MIQQFKVILWHLENRRGMYIENKYDSLISFIKGYGIAIRDHLQIDILLEFQNWLRSKQNYDFSVHWSYYVLKEMSDNNEELATKKLFELFHEFLDNR